MTLGMVLLHHLIRSALAQPRAALETPEGRRLGGDEIAARAGALAATLAAAGVQKGEPVLLAIRNEPEDLAGYLGIWEAGAVAVPYHAASLEATIVALRGRVRARFEVHRASLQIISAEAPPPRPLLEGAAIVVFTSGSTGTPKGVIVGHGALTYKLGVLSRLLQFTEEDVVLCPLQLTFIFGIWVTLLGLLSGSRVVLAPKLLANPFKPLKSATLLAAVPTLLRALAERGDISTPALTRILTGGEHLGAALAGRLNLRFPQAQIYDLYGLTETGSCDFCLSPGDQPAGLGTVGRPTDGVEFQIAPIGGLTSAGEGELQIRTPSRMIGYLDDPDLTADAFAGPLFRTGDLARLAGDGFVQLTGRLKDIVTRGGNKIAPLEIDAVFAQHPDVSGAIAAGIPDARMGECLHVLIARREGAAVNAEELKEWAAGRLEKFKMPDGIHFADALPLGANGKAGRRAAAELIALKLQKGGSG